MLFTGKNVTRSKNDTLEATSISSLAAQMKGEDCDLKNQITILRNILTLDEKNYQELKKQLPYFIGAQFNNNLRSADNFMGIYFFTLDLDKLTDKNINPKDLKQTLIKDQRIVLAFISPGGDGLKLVFSLKEKITDKKYFSEFYKLFCFHFFQLHQLENIADTTTHDVSRICFMSYDPDLYFNENAEGIEAGLILSHLPSNAEPVLPFDVPADQIEKTEKPQKEGIPNEILVKIKTKLNPGTRAAKPEKKYHVPEQLDQIESHLSALTEEYNILLEEVKPISYGKKLKFTLHGEFAELNVFHGKNGFSVVKSPKKGHHEELTEIVYQLTCDYLFKDKLKIRIENFLA